MSRRFEQDGFSSGSAALDPGRTIHGSFLDVVRAQHREPARPAIICGDRVLSHAELDVQSARFTRYLRTLGVGAGSRVGLFLHRSPEAVLAMLGILKAGAAFVPLDPAYSADLLAFIAADARLAAVVSATDMFSSQGRERPWSAPTILLDAEAADIARQTEAPMDGGASAEDLACVIYTSGAGGRPKGVMLPHRAVAHFAHKDVAAFGPSDVALHLAPLASNTSAFEIWAALLNGAALAVVASPDPGFGEIGDAIVRHGVTSAWLSASLFRAMVDHNVGSLRPLRQLIVGGDILSPEHLRRALDLLPHCRFMRGYGATENAAVPYLYAIPRDAAADGPVPIGRPIADAEVHVLDEALRPVAPGEAGELFIAGAGVALGYLNQPELTEEKFATDRFGGDPLRRMYRTGDLVRQRADGVLELIGRSDRDIEIGRERPERFWKEKLKSFDEPTLLAPALGRGRGDDPTSRPDAAGCGRLRTRLSVAATERLVGFAEQERVTLKIIVQGAWLLLLQRYCGQRTVAFGAAAVETPAERKGLDDAPGLLSQILPVIRSLRPDQSVGGWLRALRDDHLILQDHDPVRLCDIQGWAGRVGQDLFDSIVVFADVPLDQPSGEAGWAPLLLGERETAETPNWALTFVAHAADQLELAYFYQRGRLDAEQVTAIQGRFLQLIDDIVADASRALGELTLLTKEERTQILDVWSQGERRAVDASCLHELFEAQVKERPEAVAVVYDGAALTYGALNAKANQLARRLRLLGVGPDVLVGLAVERSLDMAVGLLGILKAGGAYVPLDPNYPKERLAYMIENAGLALVLTQDRLLTSLPAVTARLWRLDADWAEAEAQPATNLDSLASPQNLAYCIYTSGSTGRPKGAALEQAALVNLLQWQRSALPGGVRTLQFASFSFDVSFQEIFSAWIAGGALVIPSEDVRRDFRRLLNLLRAEAIDRLYLPAAVLQPLAAVKAASGVRLPDLRQIITAGEQLRLTPDLSAWLRAEPQCALINQYGPTETHVVSNFVATGGADGALPPIGRPIWNTQLYILDGDLNPVPAGIVGELYIGGAGLARGYLGRPELTAERFVRNPFARTSDERLYRTGDMARWRSDGQIDYVGRTDHQVKIRGFRIELGEIEARLLAHKGVREAAVIAREGASGGTSNKQLVGYFVAASGADDGPTPDEQSPAEPFVERLKLHLRAGLPDYMVPAMLVALDRMPLTPSGKIDRNALPAPEDSLGGEAKPEQAANDVEAKLAAIWRRLLRVSYVGLDANFFDLGGTSLDLIALHEEIRAQFDDIPMTTLFEQTTIRTLAARLQTRESGKLQLADIQDRKQRQTEALRRIWRRRTMSAL